MSTFDVSIDAATIVEWLQDRMHIDHVVVAILMDNPVALVQFLAGKLNEVEGDFRNADNRRHELDGALVDARRKLRAAEKNGLKMQSEIAKLREEVATIKAAHDFQVAAYAGLDMDYKGDVRSRDA